MKLFADKRVLLTTQMSETTNLLSRYRALDTTVRHLFRWCTDNAVGFVAVRLYTETQVVYAFLYFCRQIFDSVGSKF